MDAAKAMRALGANLTLHDLDAPQRHEQSASAVGDQASAGREQQGTPTGQPFDAGVDPSLKRPAAAPAQLASPGSTVRSSPGSTVRSLSPGSGPSVVYSHTSEPGRAAAAPAPLASPVSTVLWPSPGSDASEVYSRTSTPGGAVSPFAGPLRLMSSPGTCIRKMNANSSIERSGSLKIKSGKDRLVKRMLNILSTTRFLCTPRLRRLLVQGPCAALICLAMLWAFYISIYHILSVGIGPDLRQGEVCRASHMVTWWNSFGTAVNYSTQAVFTAVIATWLLCTVSSRKHWWVASFMALAWLKAYLNFWYVAFHLAGTRDHEFILQRLVLPIDGGFIFIIYWLSLRNTRMLERGMIRRLGSRSIRAIAWTLLPTISMAGVMISLEGRPKNDGGAAIVVFSLLMWYLIGSALAIAMLSSGAAGIAWYRLGCTARRASLSGTQREEVLAAKRTCFALMVWTGAGTITSLMNLTSRHLIYHHIWPIGPVGNTLCLMNLPVDFVDGISNAGIILVSSGVLSGTLRRNLRADAVETSRRLRRRAVIMQPNSSDDFRWEATVQDLANRGFTLKALLDFYRGLGHAYMPHFDPARSTTKDVVRGAIIPLSRPGRCAFATMMMQGVSTKPQAMVTHSWSNTFRDLVAAIVAHALDDACFEFAARMLDGNLNKLEEMLAWRKVLGHTYWVCAFSVNQHASICGVSHGVDTVTGLPHEPCNCGRQKFSNKTLPVTPDGRSIRCEMNKFDDMMHYMATSDQNFRQVIALDRKLDTLSRCWVVAEVVEAHKSGMHQSIKAFSVDTLREREADINHLRVEEMTASRPEDIEAILSKIEDKQAFNEMYRSIVQDGFIRWMDLPLREKLSHAGRCWLHAAY